MTYRLTALAQRHIREIEDYTLERWGTERALEYITALFDRFDMLAEQPRAGYVTSSHPNVRRYNLKHHIILYRIAGEDIDIIAVPHGSKDPDNLLS